MRGRGQCAQNDIVDLAVQLACHGGLKIFEPLRDLGKGTGAAHDLALVIVQNLDVMAKDHETVDGDPIERKMPIGKIGAESVIVDAIAGDVDHPPVAVWRARHHLRAVSKTRAKGGRVIGGPACHRRQNSDSPRDIGVYAQHGPVEVHLLLKAATPFIDAQGDIAGGATQDRMAHLGCIERRGKPDPLKIIFAGVHRRGHIKRQNQRQTTGGGGLTCRHQRQKKGGEPYQ